MIRCESFLHDAAACGCMFFTICGITDGSARVEEMSLFQRVVNTFTPAKRKRGYGHTPAKTPATVQEVTGAIQKSTHFVTKSSVKRKKATSSKRKHEFSDEV